jgi:hypothetical protein
MMICICYMLRELYLRTLSVSSLYSLRGFPCLLIFFIAFFFKSCVARIILSKRERVYTTMNRPKPKGYVPYKLCSRGAFNRQTSFAPHRAEMMVSPRGTLVAVEASVRP